MIRRMMLVVLLMTPALWGQEASQLPPPADAPNQAMFGGHIQRSMALLATSSAERRWPVKVLIYGQSIMGSSIFTGMVEQLLRERFPYADLTLENRAIGGFEAERLVRTSVHDVYPFYPDLLIFHDYGGERSGELERMISNVRRYTTADIVMTDHHQTRDGKADLEFAAKFRRYLAQKYDCELVDLSVEWPRYLQDNHLEPGALLKDNDNVHPNQQGLALMTALIGRHLVSNPLYPSGSGFQMVRWYEAKRPVDEGATDEIVFTGAPWKVDAEGVIGGSRTSGLKLQFDGNRVDVIAAHTQGLGNPGSAKILIDGKPPSEDKNLYVCTLPSKGPGTWFPSIRRVSFASRPLVEDWTLRITEINSDATRFRFRVTGSKTGFDGEGTSWEKFTSRSGRVVIEPRDWMLALIMQIFHQTAPPPVGFEVKWSVVGMFKDVYSSPITDDHGKVYATTVAQGLTNARHTLQVIPNGNGPVPIEAIQVYRPPMR